MTQKDFNVKHPSGEELTMIHYDFETGKRTLQPAKILGTKPHPKYDDEFMVCVEFTTKGSKCEMDCGTFGMLLNIDNL